MVPAPVRASLEEARRRGEPFESAWVSALTQALGAEPDERERSAWHAALEATRGPWEAAYAHETPPAAQRALALIGADPERTVPIAELASRSAGVRVVRRRDRREQAPDRAVLLRPLPARSAPHRRGGTARGRVTPGAPRSRVAW